MTIVNTMKKVKNEQVRSRSVFDLQQRLIRNSSFVGLLASLHPPTLPPHLISRHSSRPPSSFLHVEDEGFFPLATTNPLCQINYFTSGTELSHCEQHIAGINAHQLAKLCAFSKLGWLAFEGTVTHADLCVAAQCKKLGGFHSQAVLTVSDFLCYRMEGFFFPSKIAIRVYRKKCNLTLE